MNAKRIMSLGISLTGGDALQPAGPPPAVTCTAERVSGVARHSVPPRNGVEAGPPRVYTSEHARFAGACASDTTKPEPALALGVPLHAMSGAQPLAVARGLQ